jgi:hypothetical protein
MVFNNNTYETIFQTTQKKENNQMKTNETFNLDDFMYAIDYFFFEPEGSYTNDDYQLWVKIKGNQIEITDYYECEAGATDDQARHVTIPVPKTLDEAIISLLGKAMNECELEEHEVQERRDEYNDYQDYKFKRNNPLLYMIYKNQLTK